MPTPDCADVLGAAHERALAAMGTHAHVVVCGPPALLDVAADRIADLERRWSRFRPDSEVSRLNAGGGEPVAVSPETFLLVSRAVEAWRLTDGWYDPTVLDALERAGYDRSFRDPTSSVHRAAEPPAPPVPSPGAGGVALVPGLRTVRLPVGVRFDPGGIGKGLAADLVVAELRRAGAAGACVNLGGDLRVAGEPPTRHGWVLGVDDPTRAGCVVPLALDDGALVTSTRRLRRWVRAGAQLHHLIDPRTGWPSASPVHTVSVVAREAWWAEVLAKAVLLAGPADGAELARRAGVDALVAMDGGRVLELGGWADRVVRSPAGG